MSWNKAEMDAGTRYQHLVALGLVSKMLIAETYPAPGPKTVALRIESADHGKWDDIVEIVRDEGGQEHDRAWQIKDVEMLDKSDIEPLLRSLHESPQREVVLGFPEAIRIRGLGRIEQLRKLCEESRKPGGLASKIPHTKEQRALWEFVRATIGADHDEEIAALLARIQVRILGDEKTLHGIACAELAALFNPVDDVANAIEKLVTRAGPVQRIDIDVIEREVLARFESQRIPGPTRLREARKQYLNQVEQRALRRLALPGFGVTGGEVRLSDVWTPIQLSRDEAGWESAKPLADWLNEPQPGLRLIVLGEPGSGKSELLLHTAGRLASQAISDSDAPIPLLFLARELLDGLENAVRARWSLVADQVLRLLHARETSFIVFVDGLDEAGPDGVAQIEALEEWLGSRLRALVIASRPVLRWRVLQAQELWMCRWKDAVCTHFLERWKLLRPNAVAAVRTSHHQRALGELLANPLTATLCLLVAEQTPEALRSRATVYGRVVEELYDRWAASRGKPLKVSSNEVLSALQTLALEVVQDPRKAITEGDLRKALQRKIRYEASTGVESVEVHLGVLVKRGDGKYDFAFRGIGEYLAALALLEQGDGAVVEAAHHAWGQEVARHAVGWAAWAESPREAKLVQLLLTREDEDDITIANDHLRAVLVAIRAAGDLETLPETARMQLLAAAWRRLNDETSSWVGDRVADATADWVRAHGVDDEILVQWAIETICDGRHFPEHWYAAQTFTEPGPWMSLLYHHDAGVRSVAAGKLMAWVNEPTTRDWLLYALNDYGSGAGERPVAVAAGLAFRRATRDADFERVRKHLLVLLRHGWQYHRVAAAVALLPTEADPVDIVAGLMEDRNALSIPRDVLLALAEDNRGREELDKQFPNWKTSDERNVRSSYAPEKQQGDIPPPTWTVRRRLLRAIEPCLHRLSKNSLAQLQKANRRGVFQAACMMAEEDPRLVVSVLNGFGNEPIPFAWDDAALALGRAAALHQEVRQALFNLWEETKVDADPRVHGWRRGDYPGRALESLIQGGDSEALAIYGEWLIHTAHAPLLGSFDVPLLEGTDVSAALRSAARPVVEGIWRQATEGQLNERGEHTRLHALAAGAALYRLSVFWAQDSEFRRQLEGWLDDEDIEHFSAALWALQRVTLPASVRQSIAIRAREFLVKRGLDGFEPYHWWRLLHVVDSASLSTDFRPILEKLAAPDGPLAVVATALLLQFYGSEEQRKLSTRAAENFVLIDSIAGSLAVRLVSAAPEAWAKTLCGVATMGAWSSGGHWMPFVRALPMRLQQGVARCWAHAALELPWVQDRESPGNHVRPADQARRLLFDLGLEHRLLCEASATDDADLEEPPSA